MKDSVIKKKRVYLIIGCILIFISAILLVLNEVSPSTADAAKSAKELTDSNFSELDRNAVWISGKLNSANRATDTEFIKVSDCVVLRRYIERYKRYDTAHYDSDGNFQYSTTEYKWEIHNHTLIVAKNLKIDNYSIAQNVDMDFVDMPLLDLSRYVSVSVGYILSDNLIYPRHNSGTFSSPSENDVRVSYRFLRNGAEGTVIAKLSGTELVKLDYGFPKISVYSFYYKSSIDEVILKLETKSQIVLWILRAVGLMLIIAAIFLIRYDCKKRKELSDKMETDEAQHCAHSSV